MATEPTPIERQPATWYRVTLNCGKDGVHIRAKASTDAAIQGKAQNGDKLKYLHSPTALSPDSDTVKYTWHEVETLKGVTGWMALINNQTADQQFTNATVVEPPPDPDDTKPVPVPDDEYVTREEHEAAIADLTARLEALQAEITQILEIYGKAHIEALAVVKLPIAS